MYNTYTQWAQKKCRLIFDYNSWHFLNDYYAFCNRGNENEYSTVYLLNSMM